MCCDGRLRHYKVQGDGDVNFISDSYMEYIPKSQQISSAAAVSSLLLDFTKITKASQ